MARKPNYGHEKRQRELRKEQKKAEKAEKKKLKKEKEAQLLSPEEEEKE